ncbi:hypothetical protein HID58_049039, partial [Brassica napus]
FKPATAVFGASWTDWHLIVRGWFGAWPMRLDWERPWQERPICVCYEAIGGCIVGQILSLSLMVLLRKHKNLKIERQQ